jgi:threonine/homoserine/homoserine lactone efflux protein
MRSFRIFFYGMGISFLGTLPLGTLNLAALQISASDGLVPACWFSLGALLVEMAYVRISLVAIDWVRKRKQFFRWLEWISACVVVALAVSSFLAATRAENGRNIILSSTLPRFFLGMVMSAANPVQIPFWFGWSTVLLTRKMLVPGNKHYNLYLAGIGCGTFAGNGIFIAGGKLIAGTFSSNQWIVNIVIGSVFTVTAILLIRKMVKGQDPMQQIQRGP